MPRTQRRAFLLAIGAIVGASACRSTARAAKDAKTARVVSVSPSMTETAFAIGAGAKLVGRTTYCDYPEEAKKLPTIGGFIDANVEAILALEPTLVIGERRPGGRDLDQSLRDRGVETFFPPMYDVAQIRDMILALGERLDASANAKDVVGALDAKLNRVRDDVRDKARPKALFLFDFHPLVAAGPGAFPNELLGLAGAINAVTTGGEYPELSAEGVLALDPDVVIDGSAGVYPESPEVLLAAVPGLAALRAVKTGRVHRLATNAAVRPGPRIGEGVAEIAGIVHA